MSLGTGWGPDKGAGSGEGTCGLRSFREFGCYRPSPGPWGEPGMGGGGPDGLDMKICFCPETRVVWGTLLCGTPQKHGGLVFVRAPGFAGPKVESRGGVLRPFAWCSNLYFSLLPKQPSPHIPPPGPFRLPAPGPAPGGSFLVSTLEQILFNLTTERCRPCCWLPSPHFPPAPLTP